MAYWERRRQERVPGSSLFVGDREAGRGRGRFGNVDVEAVGRDADGNVMVDAPMPAGMLPMGEPRPAPLTGIPEDAQLRPGEWVAEVPDAVLERRRAEAAQMEAAKQGQWFRGPAARSVPGAAEAAGRAGMPKGVDLDGDGIPDGAEVTRTIRMQGEDGADDRTVLKWVHQAARRAAPGPLASGEVSAAEAMRVRQGLSVANRDTGRRRAAVGAVGRQMTALDRLDRLNEAEAGRGTAETVEGIRGGAAVEGARATAQGKAAEQGMDWFWKGRQDANSAADNARGDAAARLQQEQQDWQRGDRDKTREWEGEVRKRSAADVERGKAAGKSVEVKEENGVTFFHQYGDVDPRTGEPIWKPAPTGDELMRLFRGASGGVGGNGGEGLGGGGAGAPAAGTGEERVWKGRRWRLRPGADRKNQASWDDVGAA